MTYFANFIIIKVISGADLDADFKFRNIRCFANIGCLKQYLSPLGNFDYSIAYFANLIIIKVISGADLDADFKFRNIR